MQWSALPPLEYLLQLKASFQRHLTNSCQIYTAFAADLSATMTCGVKRPQLRAASRPLAQWPSSGQSAALAAGPVSHLLLLSVSMPIVSQPGPPPQRVTQGHASLDSRRPTANSANLTQLSRPARRRETDTHRRAASLPGQSRGGHCTARPPLDPRSGAHTSFCCCRKRRPLLRRRPGDVPRPARRRLVTSAWLHLGWRASG